MNNTVVRNVELLDKYESANIVIVGTDIDSTIFSNIDQVYVIDSFKPYSLQSIIMAKLGLNRIVVTQPVTNSDDILALQMAMRLGVRCTFIFDTNRQTDRNEIMDDLAETISHKNTIGSFIDKTNVLYDLKELFDPDFGQVVRYESDSLVALA